MSQTSGLYTVADYLLARLCELGLGHLFGVAGNYTAPLLDTILADPNERIALVNMPNELVAGYAADAYARVNGFAAVAVTYSVGAFHALNPFAGAYVEQIPMLLINGSLTNKEWNNETQTGLIYSHSLNDPMSNLNVFRQVTLAAERICNGIEAPYQIDAVLSACISRSGPVYLEVLEDVWRAPCTAPTAPLQRGLSYITNTSDQSSLAQALAATQAMLEQFPGTPPGLSLFFWVGAEIARQGLQAELEDLLAYTQVNYTTSVMGKGVISEDNPLFKGVFTPPEANNNEGFYNTQGQLLGNCMIGLGAWLTSKDVAFHSITSDRTTLAAHTGVRVGAEFFPLVQLGDYIAGLKTVIDNVRSRFLALPSPPRLCAQLRGDTDMTYNHFFATLSPWLSAEHVLTIDAGFPLIGAVNLPVHAAGGFICQASWLSIGYSVGAAVGAKCATPDKRVVVVVGDGAFQQTCQAVAAQAGLQHNTVVFVIKNGIYGIEQNLVNPNPFRAPDVKVDYPDPMYNEVYPYNVLYGWQYDKITECMGGIGREVSTIAKLQAVLAEISADQQSNFVVTINVPQTDSPGTTISTKSAASNPGEDELPNPAWPPEDVF
jgi:indolepyruvate decarboxylase